jgi:hypothetical protein
VPKDRYAARRIRTTHAQHGPGWWGAPRELAPWRHVGPEEAVRFAIKYKLACWGMFTYAGVDDAYVVTGGYSEF